VTLEVNSAEIGRRVLEGGPFWDVVCKNVTGGDSWTRSECNTADDTVLAVVGLVYFRVERVREGNPTYFELAPIGRHPFFFVGG